MTRTPLNVIKFWYKKIYIVLIIFFVSYFSAGCLPGINKNVKKQGSSEPLAGNYTMNDVTIDVIEFQNLNENQINKINSSEIKEFQYSISEFPKIYNYKYAYALDTSDVISINLTDTDDIDGTYIVDPVGNIDLPFVGKINIKDLTLSQTKDKLTTVLKQYYKSYDLQISVVEFNSSKVYILGAVRNQITIDLDQKPIRLIDAAIKANYNPNAADKNFGNKGLLRRDDQVYKIDINKIYKSTDNKDNFYLKKNDVIFVDRNYDALHVFGEVSKPGIYFPNLDYSITELISSAGINQLTADASKVYIIREDYNAFLKLNVFKIDISKPVNLVLGKKFKLKPKDIIYIPPTKLVKLNRVISLLIPQTDLFRSYNPIIQEGMKASSANET
jgi:polysaccharide biosynthesis/export protein